MTRSTARRVLRVDGGTRSRVALAFGATFVGGGVFVLATVSATGRRADASAARTSPAARALEARAGDRASALVELGRRLFFDPSASHSKTKACSSCHDPDHGWSDRRKRGDDDFGTTRRHSQTVLNLPSAAPLHWDGEFDTLEALVYARTGDVRSADGGYGLSGPELLAVTPVATTLARDGLYAEAFEAAFGDPTPTREGLASAIAAFVRTLKSTRSAYDRHAAGDTTAMSPSAVRGLELFRGRAGCAQCHTMDDADASFTDGQFHDTGLSGPDGDPGRGGVTQDGVDRGAFRTPSLRDVAERPPYMHDGRFHKLEDVVRYYAVGCGNGRNDGTIDSRIRPFDAGRSREEVRRDAMDLTAFLGALTSETRPGLTETAWSVRAARTRLRLVWESGAPYRRMVGVSPAGDVVPAPVSSPRSRIEVLPDADGWIEFEPFATTHAEIQLSGGSRPRGGDFVPDTCAQAMLTLVCESELVERSSVDDVGDDTSAVRLELR
jgi:cytochrome c peroxidase